MPDQEKSSGAESPTTAKQLDFDDDHEVHEGHASGESRPQPASVEDEEAPPAKPPRPVSPQQQAEHTLIEAFPSIDAKVVRAVLTASGGQVEPAFNALLGMSDPSFKEEDVPPPQPPRPTAAQRQLEQDEMYARQLAQHYQTAERGQQRGYAPERGYAQGQQRTSRDHPDERERNFFDDDLPEIKESVRQGFLQTQSTVNGWLKNFKKRIDGDEDDPYNGPTRLDSRPQRPDQHSEWPRPDPASRTRRSGDYDADPRELGDDFTSLELRDDEAPPPKPARPAANPDLFKPTPAPPQSGPVDEVDAAERRSAQGGGGAQKKWQPLTAVAAQPEPDDDDPFSVGDSDDDKESKTKDVREADTARLKEAARKSISEGGGEGTAGKPLEERKRGSISFKDKDAEELLAKK
ncbi:hypothetical protein ANO11243_044160 [Dothideomycetidae sp. 11243]|nr:hypothetical protein ANO11243_044160 [fungal sp. No.11243]